MADVEITTDRRIATLWLNRPQRHNAFDEDLIQALTGALRQVEQDPAVRVVVLAGRGRSFCAGGDLAWMRRMADHDFDDNLRDAGALAEMLRTLATLAKPTVARVQGAALAGGTGLVAACDIAIAESSAVFGTTEVRLGLVPATISPYVIGAIGARAAQRYFLTGERFDAEAARALGLVHEVVSADALDARVDQIASALLAGAPTAAAAIKHLVADVAGQPIDARLIALTCQAIAQARASQDAREGIAAFFDKRAPSWSL
jgi:methylglutaconyl-CoA hydratase